MEMHFLAVRQRNLWMFFQKIMERGRAGLLRAGDDKIEPLHFVTLKSEHSTNRLLTEARCPRDNSL